MRRITQYRVGGHDSSKLVVRGRIRRRRDVSGIGMQGPQLAAIGMDDLLLAGSSRDTQDGIRVEGAVIHAFTRHAVGAGPGELFTCRGLAIRQTRCQKARAAIAGLRPSLQMTTTSLCSEAL